jgi:hypothetical protein
MADKPKYIVIRDVQEKVNYWDFPVSESCDGTVVEHLKTADYTIKGLESEILIERKANIDEFAANLTQPRFVRELERLNDHTIPSLPVVILCFELSDLTDWPSSSGTPPHIKKNIKTTGKFLMKRLAELMVRFPRVNFIFAGSEGKDIAASLLKRVWEKYNAK